MKLWRRIERFFKHNQLRFLEKWLGVPELLPEKFEFEKIKKIIVIRQHDQLGDFLLSTPVFHALRNQFPDAHIAVMARKYTASLMQHNEYVDTVITFYEHGKDWNLGRITKFIKLLRRGYDLAIVLNTVSHSLTSDLAARLSGAKYVLGPEHLTFQGTTRNFFYHFNAPYIKQERNQSLRNLDILSYIGIQAVEPYEHITLLTEEKNDARELLLQKGWDGKQMLISVHPGAGKLMNRWPVENFAKAAQELADYYDAQLLITWGPNEKELGESLCSQLKGNIITAVDPDIRRFASILSCSDMILCNDTGVLHVAAAINLPLVVVFGPTNPAEWKPFGKKFVALQGERGRCDEIGPEKVIEAAKMLIN